jgi:Fe-S-cluster containining protein
MADGKTSSDEVTAAGDFSSWVADMQRALRGERSSDVPCDGCTACCTSSQFVHVEPDEHDTLSHIPADLLFPAPRMPRGHVLLGYDERGHCPMLVENRCSIYEHRPRTCRTYDCRVFPAAGIEIEEADKDAIAQRARRWEFAFPAPEDRTGRDAVRAAATFLREHVELLTRDGVPASATQIAVVATELHDFFLRRNDATGATAVVEPDLERIRTELRNRVR